MAFASADRVKETSTTTGTGTISLGGAVSGFQTFVAGIGNANTCHYAIVHQSAAEWEVGLGTVTDGSPDTLARTTVYASSNSGSAVNFSAGTKDVFVTFPANEAAKLPTYAVGPASATDNAIVRFDGTTGKLIQNSAVTVEDSGALRLNGSSSGYVGLAPAAVAGSTTYTLPSADGSNGQVLSTDGSGTLSWATASGGSGGGLEQVFLLMGA